MKLEKDKFLKAVAAVRKACGNRPVRIISIGSGLRIGNALVHSLGVNVDGEACEGELFQYDNGEWRADGIISVRFLA